MEKNLRNDIATRYGRDFKKNTSPYTQDIRIKSKSVNLFQKSTLFTLILLGNVAWVSPGYGGNEYEEDINNQGNTVRQTVKDTQGHLRAFRDNAPPCGKAPKQSIKPCKTKRTATREGLETIEQQLDHLIEGCAGAAKIADQRGVELETKTAEVKALELRLESECPEEVKACPAALKQKTDDFNALNKTHSKNLENQETLAAALQKKNAEFDILKTNHNELKANHTKTLENQETLARALQKKNAEFDVLNKTHNELQKNHTIASAQVRDCMLENHNLNRLHQNCSSPLQPQNLQPDGLLNKTGQLPEPNNGCLNNSTVLPTQVHNNTASITLLEGPQETPNTYHNNTKSSSSNEPPVSNNSGWFDWQSIPSKVYAFGISTSSTIGSWWEENSPYIFSKGNLFFSSALSGGAYSLVPTIIRDVAPHDADNVIKLVRIGIPLYGAYSTGSPGPLLGLVAPAVEYGFEQSSVTASAISVAASVVCDSMSGEKTLYETVIDCGISFVGSVAGSTLVPNIYKNVKTPLIHTYNFCKSLVHTEKDRNYKTVSTKMEDGILTITMIAED